jgi:pimeloyl-ACP methyl ester carboxylesterase
MAAYEIHVPDSQLSQLQQKLENATFPDELSGASWDYGAPLSEIKRLAAHWTTTYDWRAQETKLNTLPQYHRSIKADNFEALDIHYIHQTSPAPNAIPLLFVHGWPGSYLEVLKILPALQLEMNGVAFHVVAPSLPNFGWSEGPKRRGFALREYAQTCHRLMQALGYDRYVTQGGDWGFMITRTMGLLYPEAVLASHVNMVRANPPSFVKHPLLALQHALGPYSEREKAGKERNKWFLEEGAGYRQLQASKPQTLGYALQDSPVGLLAWMYEKLHDWTDGYEWTDDEILTWVSVYWFSTAGPAASLRVYYEAVHDQSAKGDAIHRDRTGQWIPKVKLGLLHAPKEITVVPKTWGRTLGPVVFESEKKKGGHFAAHEIPGEVVADLRTMFGKGGPCFKIMGPSLLKSML